MRNECLSSLLGRFRRHSSRIALLALMAMLPAAGGCYGRFPMTKAVYRFNGSCSDNEIVQNVVFWVFIILPVYELTQLGDAIIFNLIEFWTGESINLSAVEGADGTEVALTPSEDGREIRLMVTKQSKVVAETRFVKIADSVFEVRDSRNRIAGMVIRTDDGSFNLTDAKGRVIRTIPPRASAEESKTGITG